MKKIKLLVGSAKTKEGKKFTTYKVLTKEGKKIDCRFTKAVKNIPEKSCYIHVEDKNINLDSQRLYPCFWVKQIEATEELESTSKLDNYFEEVK